MGKLLHKILLPQMEKKTTGKLNVKGKIPKNENVLYVANHFCIEDIPTLAQAVKEHFYPLVSDEDRYTLDGLGLSLNGVVWVKRTNKKSRQRASRRAVKLLKSGKSFAMFPEATWNLSPNLLMLPMNYGCINIAREANVAIVPVVMFFSEAGRYAYIGEKFYPNSDSIDSINKLRDIMAGMLYSQIEKYGNINDFNKNAYWDNVITKNYDSYKRAANNKLGVFEFESQFIYTSKSDCDKYFLEFNCCVKRDELGKYKYKRITSENLGYNSDWSDKFGYGYKITN